MSVSVDGCDVELVWILVCVEDFPVVVSIGLVDVSVVDGCELEIV